MKLSTLLIAASLALPVALPANAHGPDKHNGEKLIEALQLDQARAEEVRKILRTARDKREQLHRETRKAMKEVHVETQEQLKQVLTDEEIAQLEELKAQKRKKHADRKHYKKH